MSATLDQAMKILRTARIEVMGAALVNCKGKELATILLRSIDDREKALQILAQAGLKVKAGAA